MTTIAWDGVSVAADGRGTQDGVIMSDRDRKLFKRGGVIIGVAGEWAGALPLVEYITGEEWDAEAAKCHALVIDGQRGEVYEGCRHAYRVYPPYAIGSGAIAALAAMMAGATAKQAVKIACRLDPGSGGRICEMRP